MTVTPKPNDCQRLASDQEALDRCFMAEALTLAGRVPQRTWPNPPVGAVVVKDGKVIGRGAHAGPGQLHAEPVALAQAGPAARGATLYVTLEPCNHQGRTPPCAPAVVASGITRVVVGMRDPNPAVLGGGCRFLRDRGVEVRCGVLGEECLELVWPFVTTGNFTRVYVELKTATSLDGLFAPAATGARHPSPIYLTGEKARQDVHRHRRRVDLVLVGKRTAMADRPRLDGRLAADNDGTPAAEPMAGYVDTHLEYSGGLDRDSFFVFAGESAQGSPRAEAVTAGGGTIIYCREQNGQVDPRNIMEQAAMRDILSIMVEGGPTLAHSFLREGLVDRWLSYTAPTVLGSGVGWPGGKSAPGFADSTFSLTRTRQLGRDLLAVYDKRSFQAQLGQVTI